MNVMVYMASIHLAWEKERNHDRISRLSRCCLQTTREDLLSLKSQEGRLFILSKERLMDPHPDCSDYRSITCTILAAWLEDPIRGWRNRVRDG